MASEREALTLSGRLVLLKPLIHSQAKTRLVPAFYGGTKKSRDTTSVTVSLFILIKARDSK